MKSLTTRQLIKQLECCDQDSLAVMRDKHGNLQYIHSVDEDMSCGQDSIWLLSDYIDIQHMQSELLSEGEDYLDFVSVSILQ